MRCKVTQMTEAEARRAIIATRPSAPTMMQALQQRLRRGGRCGGRRRFLASASRPSSPIAELNALAASVNNLVETVDRGLGETGEVLSALADTDLTQRMEGDYRGRLRAAQGRHQCGGRQAERDRRPAASDTSRALKTATGEILSGANDLSERTTKQAATIEETSAAMEQLAATVLQNAKRAKRRQRQWPQP